MNRTGCIIKVIGDSWEGLNNFMGRISEPTRNQIKDTKEFIECNGVELTCKEDLLGMWIVALTEKEKGEEEDGYEIIINHFDNDVNMEAMKLMLAENLNLSLSEANDLLKTDFKGQKCIIGPDISISVKFKVHNNSDKGISIEIEPKSMYKPTLVYVPMDYLDKSWKEPEDAELLPHIRSMKAIDTYADRRTGIVYGFMEADISDLCKDNDIDCTICRIEYDVRYLSVKNLKKIVSNTLKEIDNAVILIEAFCSTDKYSPEEYYMDESDYKEGKKPLPLLDEINRLSYIMYKAGFESINELVQYEYSVPFLYTGNDTGRNVMDIIRSHYTTEWKDILADN